MMGYRWYGNGLCGNWFGPGIWSILIAVGLMMVLAAVIFWAIKRNGAVNAAEALKLRYVKGEITEEEYLKRKSVIDGKG